MSKRVSALAVLLLFATVAGCGSRENGATITTVSNGTFALPVAIPSDSSPEVTAQLNEGANVALSTGCLSCHQLGRSGNNGPGGKLTGVGTRLTRAQIAKALRDPPAPMPSFSHLPPHQFTALVAYLASQR